MTPITVVRMPSQPIAVISSEKKIVPTSAACITSVLVSMVPTAKFDMWNNRISRKVATTWLVAAPKQCSRYSAWRRGAPSPSHVTTAQR